MIHLKSNDEIDKIQQAGIILTKALEKLSKLVAPGITTDKLDIEAGQMVNELGGRCAFRNYRGFPKNICTSINEEVVHGIPSNRELIQGDIISIDIGIERKNFYADAAVTIGVGKISPEARKLLQTTNTCLYKAIDAAVVGNRLYDISYAVQTEAESNGFSVVRDLVGHGIGSSIHEDPQVPNFVQQNKGSALQSGMVLAIEPMINIGTHKVEILKDGWTYVTEDRRLSAHFEHTVAITDDGPKILTRI